jgi:hypothetical protein
LGAWSFGLQGLYSEWEQAILGANAGKEHALGASFNGAYALGPGISLEGQVAYSRAGYGYILGVPVPLASAGVDATIVHAFEFDIGTAINF